MEGVDGGGRGAWMGPLIGGPIIDSSFRLASASCMATLSASLFIDLILFLLKPE